MLAPRLAPGAAIAALLLLAGSQGGCDRARPLAGTAGPHCTSCHGGSGSPDGAPPNDLHGDPAGPGVGAHQPHLSHGVACGECHRVPERLGSPGHLDQLDGTPDGDGRAEVNFGPLARRGGWPPAYDAASRTCSVYCHGASLGAAAPATPPRWTDRGPLGCTGCHRAAGAHARHATRDPALLAYGDTRVLEELDPTYASHQSDYAFGCGFCHPIGTARHQDGAVQVELSPGAAPAGTLRAANRADATYDEATGTCSGVACHATGQATPAYTNTTAWRGGPNPAGCFGCHGNPPDYANGGPGALNANSHLDWSTPWTAPQSWTWGHARSSHTMPHGGEWDGSYFNNGWGSARSCQACHFETVDPANTAPGGFMYLDTTVRTELALINGAAIQTQFACTTCHTGAAGAPPTGVGKALPWRHVNGRRDVVFDPRTTVPAGYGYPQATWGFGNVLPAYPYWFNHAFNDFYQDAVIYKTPLTQYVYYGVLSFPLTEARWDPATKTCTSVACHYNQAAPGESVTWGGPLDLPAPVYGCVSCHG